MSYLSDARAFLDDNGIKSLRAARNALTDDRSHGDDYLAAAAYEEPILPLDARDVAGYVARVFHRAHRSRVEEEGSGFAGIWEHLRYTKRKKR